MTQPTSEFLDFQAALAGEYSLQRELGRGGMGIVYAAYDTALQRPVALKQVRRQPGEDGDELERLLQEARMVAKLRHPRLAEIYNVLVEGDLFLVFERVQGRSLDLELQERLRLPLPEARRVLGDVAAAVGYAHEQRIIHRDLKPSNIMREPSGSCKVMDFGIAHQASGAATILTRACASGTPPYMAPEQAMGSVSKASDLYALGVMAYELLSGRRPFMGPDFLEQKLHAKFAPITAHDASLPRGLDGFFQTALHPDPTKRLHSAAAFLDAFDRAASS
jgi:serine/threonine protein kinase